MEILKQILTAPAFFVVSFIVIVAALGVVLETNIIRAGFSLVICFSAVSAVYFVLGAPFVGASQLLIYSVGITLVIVFALMLTSFKQEFAQVEGEGWKNLLSAIISLGVFITLSHVLLGNKWLVAELLSCPRNTEIVGLKLLGTYMLPFELISVLLLVALIGAVVIAKRDKKRSV